MSRPIAYEPHPVSPERKAELVGQGFKIIDAAFKPADAPAAKRGGKRAAPDAAPTAPTEQQEA